MTIRTVVFDLGDVVCRFRPERRLRALAHHSGLEPAVVDDAIWNSGLDRRAELGALPPEDVTDALLGALGSRLEPDQLRAAWALAFDPDDAVVALVGRLRVPAVLFTNNGPMLGECLRHELAAVADRFERIVCSWELRAVKPEPQVFRRLCARLDQPPRDLLFVDDREANTRAAREVGLATITFTDAPRLERGLDALALLRTDHP